MMDEDNTDDNLKLKNEDGLEERDSSFEEE